MRTVEPMGNNVLVSPIRLPSVSIGGIHLPAESLEKSGEGRVVSVGPGKMDYMGRMIPIPLKPGDTVMHLWLHGQEVKIDGQIFRVVNADEILAVIRNV